VIDIEVICEYVMDMKVAYHSIGRIVDTQLNMVL
jgi:hypothetical protein